MLRIIGTQRRQTQLEPPDIGLFLYYAKENKEK